MWIKPWFLTGAFLWAAVSGERLLIMIATSHLPAQRNKAPATGRPCQQESVV